MSQFDIKSRKPVVAKKAPIGVDVEEGKTYYWCTCGLSKSQPFCDGSHKQVPDHPGPMAYKATESKKLFFCACKSTATAPLCDGSHKKIPASIKEGDEYEIPQPGEVRLTYFDIYGYGELSRILLTVAGCPFEDRRVGVNFGPDEFKAVAKGNTDVQWTDLKSTTPYGKVPVLEFKGVQIAHSWAICRFVARRFALMGDNEIEAALIDATFEQLRDGITAYLKYQSLPEGEQDAFKANFVAEIGTHIAPLEQQIKANGDGKYLVGSRYSLADYAFFALLSPLANVGGALKDQAPTLFDLFERVPQVPALKKYLEARPQRPI